MLDSAKQMILDLFSAFRRETDEKLEHLRLRIKREMYEELAALATARATEISAELDRSKA